MVKGETGHHEGRKFKQNIERESQAVKSLSVGALRVIAGVAKEHLGTPDVSISEDQLKDVMTRDVRRHPLDMSHAVEASHSERKKVPEDMVATEAQKWAGEMAGYLQDRTKMPWDVAKILSKKFDLMLDENPKMVDGQDKKAQTIANRVETMIWNTYLKGDGKGVSDIQQFIKDFVDRDSYTTVASNVEKIKPFLGIFGKESTIGQIEDGILAFAALNTLGPLSKERRDLVDHIKNTAGKADPKDMAHYNPENYQKEEVIQPARARVPEASKNDGANKEPRLIESGRTSELNREGWHEVAKANEIDGEVFEKEYERISEKLSQEQREVLDESIAKVLDDLEAGEVRQEHIIRLIEPADGENPQRVKTYVVYKQSEDTDDMKIFEMDLNPRYRYFSDEGRLYELDKSGKNKKNGGLFHRGKGTDTDEVDKSHVWLWYQKKGSNIEKSDVEKKFDEIALKEKIENDKAEFLEKGYREVGTVYLLSPEEAAEFKKSLDALESGTDEQKAQYENMDEKVQADIAEKGFSVLHLLQPAEGENPEKDRMYTLFPSRSGGFIIGEIHKNEGMDELNVDNGRWIRTMDENKFTWWLPPEEPELAPAPVEGYNTDAMNMEMPVQPSPEKVEDKRRLGQVRKEKILDSYAENFPGFVDVVDWYKRASKETPLGEITEGPLTGEGAWRDILSTERVPNNAEVTIKGDPQHGDGFDVVTYYNNSDKLKTERQMIVFKTEAGQEIKVGVQPEKIEGRHFTVDGKYIKMGEVKWNQPLLHEAGIPLDLPDGTNEMVSGWVGLIQRPDGRVLTFLKNGTAADFTTVRLAQMSATNYRDLTEAARIRTEAGDDLEKRAAYDKVYNKDLLGILTKIYGEPEKFEEAMKSGEVFWGDLSPANEDRIDATNKYFILDVPDALADQLVDNKQSRWTTQQELQALAAAGVLNALGAATFLPFIGRNAEGKIEEVPNMPSEGAENAGKQAAPQPGSTSEGNGIAPETPAIQADSEVRPGETNQVVASSGADFGQTETRRKGLGDEVSSDDEKTRNLDQSIQADQPLQKTVASEQQIESREAPNPGVFKDTFNQLLETHGIPGMSNIPVDQQRSEFERLLKLHGATDEELPQLMERFDGLAGQGQAAVDDWNHKNAIADAKSEDLLAQYKSHSGK